MLRYHWALNSARIVCSDMDDFLRAKGSLARQLAECSRTLPRWARSIECNGGVDQAWADREFGALIEYLLLYFKSGERSYLELYVGEKLKQVYDPTRSRDDRKTDFLNLLAAERKSFEAFALRNLNEAARQHLLKALDEVAELLTSVKKKVLNVLFVGDCIHLDINAFLASLLAQAGLEIVPAFLTGRTESQIADGLSGLSNLTFDVVFFSPYSYDFNHSLSHALSWRQAWKTGQLDSAIEEAFLQAELILRHLAGRLDCPIYVHTFGGVVREPQSLKRALKRRLTSLARKRACDALSSRTRALVEAVNQSSYRHVFLLDENDIVDGEDEHSLGAFFYHSELQHPAYYGRALASRYAAILEAHAFLVTRKLIVTDLDNTLWDGVIGEGTGVRHFHDRQSQLLALKQRGVVLAICSKNDPVNVHWSDAKLNWEDFVHSEISWARKFEAMQRVQETLNLKYSDYVFLDDRADEREVITKMCPGVLALDPNDQRTWDLFALWCGALDETSELDRTRAYQERERRKQIIDPDQGAPAGASEDVMRSLEICLSVRHARSGDLKRTAELINRTNQFNLTGKRTSYSDVRRIHDDPRSIVLLGEARDRFGNMGIISVMLLTPLEANCIEIEAFVLSCRAFGFSVEYAMLECAKDLAEAAGSGLRGIWQPTGRNQPSEHVLRESRFTELPSLLESTLWNWPVGGARRALPDWLTISGRHSLKPLPTVENDKILTLVQ